MSNLNSQQTIAPTGPLSGIISYWVEAQDSLRTKAFASIAIQVKKVVKFIRAEDAGNGKVRTVSKILYPNTARGTGLPPVSGSGSFPFGGGTPKVGSTGLCVNGRTRIYLDAAITSAGTTLTSATAAFVAADVGKQITIDGASTAGSEGPDTPTTQYNGQIASLTSGTEVEVNPAARATVTNAKLVIEPVLMADDGSGELGNGWIIGADYNFWSGVPKRGQCYLEMEVNRGAWNMHEGVTLIQGYLGPSEHLGWPYGTNERKASGKGGIVTYTVTAARGAEWSHTCPANARQKLISARVSLVASATAGNRQPIFLVDDGTSVFASYTAPAVQAPGASHAYILSAASRNDSITPPVGAIQQHVACSPAIELSETYRLRTSTPNLDTNGATGDQYSGFVTVEEWIEE